MTRSGESFNFRPLHCKTQALDREGGATGAAAISYNFRVNHTPQLWNVKSAGVDAPYPVAITETVSTPTNTALTIDVLSNDIGSGLTLTEVNDWTENGGRASIVENKVRYTPQAGFAGTDTFWYAMQDSQGRVNSVKITVEVTGEGTVNPSPVGIADSASTLVNTAITIDVLANDIGAGLTIPNLGGWSLQAGILALVDNKVLYTPKQGFTGEDKFWYTFTDSQGRSNYGEVTITVAANAAYPVAIIDNANTAVNTAVTIDVLANDTGLGLSILDVNAYAANGGTVVQSGSQLVYTPANNYSGQDSFWYAISDSIGRANAVQVFVNVGG
jgi:hypothetical protein